MTAIRIDGKAVAARLRARVALEAQQLRERSVIPTLAVVLVGDDPASAIHVRNKAKAAAEAQIGTRDHKLPAATTQAELVALIEALNGDASVDGILVQMPLPPQIDPHTVIRTIDPAKDVDGLHPANLGRLAQGRPSFVPCTPRGCMQLLNEARVDIAGARAVVIGRSLLVGTPMALLLTNANATVTLCHSRTRDIADEVRRADIVVTAIGRAELVQGAWIKPGAAVVDVGMNRNAAGKLCGDVEFAAAAERASAITPVPGGVGPMTIACLLENTVIAAQRHRGISIDVTG
jgi:methylenetetrahydrofolate dehydrogenase (NADP+)/methenyltetrahydrofolate cyclohydrolase